jgi:hypothetical protein
LDKSVSFVVDAVPRRLFHVARQLSGDAAKIVLSSFAPPIGLKTVNLDVPVHQSADWESIELDKYTFAFRCLLDA